MNLVSPQVVLPLLTIIGYTIDHITTRWALGREEFFERNKVVVAAINRFGLNKGLVLISLATLPVGVFIVWFMAGYVGWWATPIPAVVLTVPVWNLWQIFGRRKLSAEELAAAKIREYFRVNYGRN